MTQSQEPPAAAVVFGDRLDLARRYAETLADSGVVRGLIGPREVPRLWERHLLNCAVLTELIPPGAHVIDVGSGAGLPGLAVAIARPDTSWQLLEPMLRRTTWLEEVVADLGLDNVVVLRGRAESLTGDVQAALVTARAVARLGTLAGWCTPLLLPGGSVLALKGANAREELAADQQLLRAAGVVRSEVMSLGAEFLDEPTTVVRLTVASSRPAGSAAGRTARSAGGRKNRTRRQVVDRPNRSA